MYLIDILSENADLLNRHKQVLSAIQKDIGLEPKETLNLATRCDPSGKYIIWIFKQIRNKSIIGYEDAPRVEKALNLYNRLKQKKAKDVEPDILKYNTLNDLEKAIDPYDTEKIEQSNIKDPTTLPGVKEFATYEQYKIYEVTDPKSLGTLGKGTRWCTREGYDENNETARNYLKSGPIYVIMQNNKPVFQASNDLEQFKDIHDSNAYKTNFKLVKFLLTKIDNPMAYVNVAKIEGKRIPEFEPAIATSAKAISRYAQDILNQRWKSAESKLVSNPIAAVDYADKFMQGKRWPLIEPFLHKNGFACVKYYINTGYINDDMIKKIYNSESGLSKLIYYANPETSSRWYANILDRINKLLKLFKIDLKKPNSHIEQLLTKTSNILEYMENLMFRSEQIEDKLIKSIKKNAYIDNDKIVKYCHRVKNMSLIDKLLKTYEDNKDWYGIKDLSTCYASKGETRVTVHDADKGPLEVDAKLPLRSKVLETECTDIGTLIRYYNLFMNYDIDSDVKEEVLQNVTNRILELPFNPDAYSEIADFIENTKQQNKFSNYIKQNKLVQLYPEFTHHQNSDIIDHNSLSNIDVTSLTTQAIATLIDRLRQRLPPDIEKRLKAYPNKYEEYLRGLRRIDQVFSEDEMKFLLSVGSDVINDILSYGDRKLVKSIYALKPDVLSLYNDDNTTWMVIHTMEALLPEFEILRQSFLYSVEHGTLKDDIHKYRAEISDEIRNFYKTYLYPYTNDQFSAINIMNNLILDIPLPEHFIKTYASDPTPKPKEKSYKHKNFSSLNTKQLEELEEYIISNNKFLMAINYTAHRIPFRIKDFDKLFKQMPLDKVEQHKKYIRSFYARAFPRSEWPAYLLPARDFKWSPKPAYEYAMSYEPSEQPSETTNKTYERARSLNQLFRYPYHQKQKPVIPRHNKRA